MSLALIQESAKEARRLAIAGSPLAVGDFRLKKLIGPLEQAGVKVPVFAQVAKAISDLVNGKESDSAAQLLNLSTLLNAILYTQGQTGTDAPCQKLEISSASNSTTRTSARMLKPIVEALTTTGAGRFEVVEAAVERGVFNDLRLIEPSIRALDDNYPELADLVAKKILPAYGPGIVPLLKRNLDLKGKKSDGRRLSVMHQLDPMATIELCTKALGEGSPEVKVAAIACLGAHEECIPLLLDQASAKNKAVRSAALEALARHDRPEVSNLFTGLIKSKSFDLLIHPLRLIRNRNVLNSLLQEGKGVFDLLLKGDADQMVRYWEILECLAQRKDAEAEEFLLGCFNHFEKLAKLKTLKNAYVSIPDLTGRMTSLLLQIGTPKALESILAKRTVLPVESFSDVFRSAWRLWPAERVFEEFSPLLEQKKPGDKLKTEYLERTIRYSCREESVDPDGLDQNESSGDKREWDPRWLDVAIKTDRLEIVCCLARSNHQESISYLVKQVDVRNSLQIATVFKALARCGYPQVTDVFLETVAKKTKKARAFDYDLQLLFSGARYLPAADLPKLDAFATTLDEKFVDRYLEALGPLRDLKQPI